MPKKITKKGKKVVTKKVVRKGTRDIKNKVCFAGSLVVKSPFSKSQIANALAKMACLRKKDAVSVIGALFEIISAHLKKRAPGEFTLPGMIRFRTISKPATKARYGVNPFTGQSMIFAAKPARSIVKIRPLKKLKDIVK